MLQFHLLTFWLDTKNNLTMDNIKLSKILTIVAGAISLIGVFFMVRIIMVGDDTLKSDAAAQSSVISPFVTFALIILVTVAVVAVVLSLLNLVKNPQNLKKSLMGVGVLGVVLLLTYFTASDAAVLDSFGDVVKDGEAGNVSKWVSALINFTGILGAAGLGIIGFGIVKNVIK